MYERTTSEAPLISWAARKTGVGERSELLTPPVSAHKITSGRRRNVGKQTSAALSWVSGWPACGVSGVFSNNRFALSGALDGLAQGRGGRLGIVGVQPHSSIEDGPFEFSNAALKGRGPVATLQISRRSQTSNDRIPTLLRIDHLCQKRVGNCSSFYGKDVPRRFEHRRRTNRAC